MWPIVSGYCKLSMAMNVSGKDGQSTYVSPVMLPEHIRVLVYAGSDYVPCNSENG